MRLVKRPNRDESKKVTRMYLWIFIALSVLFFARLMQLMIFKTANGHDLTTLVNQMYNRDEVVPARRGYIYDVAGEVIATDVKAYSAYAVITDKYPGTAYVQDKVKTAKALAKHLSMSEDDILSLLNQNNVNQTTFGNAGANLSYTVKEAIEAENLEGIYFNEKITRDYPKGYFSNSVIGVAQDTREDTSVDTPHNTLQGIMGIEKMYNAQLTGIDGLVNYDRDAYGFSIPGTQRVIESVQHGNNVYTTLDSRLNDYLEGLVSKAYEQYQPESLSVMVVRAKTGDVVAVSQRPTYNVKTQEYPETGWTNRLVEQAFEPGSTMKVLALAAAINEGIFSPMDLYMSGSVKVGNITIRDWNRKGWGEISYLKGLVYSSNVAFVELISRMGYDKWEKYLEAFGFGQSTQSGFPNETAGLNSYQNEEIKASTTFGQGISVTAYQLVQALTAIANEGKIQKLRFVDRVENAETKEVTYTPIETISSPIKPETAKQVLSYLEYVIYDESTDTTGKQFKPETVRVAGKTGTAQIFDASTGRYLENQYMYSFAGFFPSESPEFLMFLAMDRPKNTTYNTTYDIFNPFADFAMSYIKTTQKPETVEPEKTSGQQGNAKTTQMTQTSVSEVVLPDAAQADAKKAKSELEKLGFKDILIIGSGETVEKQLPTDNETYTTDTKVMLYTGGKLTMPDMIGWPKSDVLKFEQLTGISFVYEGQGYVTQQSVSVGTPLDGAQEILITLAAPDVKVEETVATTTVQTSTVTTTISTR